MLGFLFHRKRFGKYNVILSDIRKPPSNVFHSGRSRVLHWEGGKKCILQINDYKETFEGEKKKVEILNF